MLLGVLLAAGLLGWWYFGAGWKWKWDFWSRSAESRQHQEDEASSPPSDPSPHVSQPTPTSQTPTLPSQAPAKQIAEGDDATPSEIEKPESAAAQKGMELADLVEQVKPAVVVIKTDSGLGSGFVVSGLGINCDVVTNYHVIQGAREATVSFGEDGSVSDEDSIPVAGYLAIDPGKDLALLRIRTRPGSTVLPLAEDLPREGTKVAAFGSPRGFTFTTSEGIVSAIRAGKEVRDVFLERVQFDVYRFNGYDLGATWVQTTAAISGGSSGGPLVDMEGRVVGVNTWSHATPGSQNLNFAIASQELRQLLLKADKTPRPLSTLPETERDSAVVHDDPRYKITLPSGAELSDTILRIPKNWRGTYFPGANSVYEDKYPDGSLLGFYTYEEGKLHGPAVRLYESGRLMALAHYHMSKRDGELRSWNEQRQQLLYAKFVRGRKDGLLCLFRDDLPWLIQQWDKDQLVDSCLVKFEVGVPRAIPETKLSEEETTEYLEAKKELSELAAEMEANEDKLRVALRAWYREEDQRRKRQMASRLSPIKRDRISARNRAKEAAVAAEVFRRRWQAALARTGF
jgi:S1-C subfamily serine protease